VVLGYSNGVYTYIPTRRILREGGYAADQALSVGFPARFAPEVEDLLLTTVRRLASAVVG